MLFPAERIYWCRKDGGAVNIIPFVQELEAVGFREELLDRAVALAGADRLLYRRLCRAVSEGGMAPGEALDTVKRELSN